MHLLPAALREAQLLPIFNLLRDRFSGFRPAGATPCTDGGEIWHGGPLLHAKLHPLVQRLGYRTAKSQKKVLL